MNQSVKAQNLFRPSKPSPTTKADLTDRHAREILEAEAAQREAKTAKLREARIQAEASASEPDAPEKPRRQAKPKPKRAVSSM